MSPIQWLSRFWGAKAPPMPAMLRIVMGDGTPAETITLDKTWQPSGRSETLQYRTAAGLCLIPWLGNETRLTIRVTTPEGSVELEVPRDRPDAGRVHDVTLDARPRHAPARAATPHALVGDLALAVALEVDAAE